MTTLPSAEVVFKEDSQCKQCHASFNFVRRRHHCRACGNSFCDAHAPKRNGMANGKQVRLCDSCLSNMKRSAAKPAAAASSAPKSARASAAPAPAPAGAATEPETRPRKSTAGPPPWCTCGMPLCICDPPAEEAPAARAAAAPAPAAAARATAAAATPAAGAGAGAGASQASKPRAQASSSSPFTPFGFAAKKYDNDVEGLRDAIKNGDAASVRKILAADGSLATEMDRSGQTMLHLAAMFNHSQIAQILVTVGGADPSVKNCLGETVYEVSEEALKAWLQANA